jgi:hypothetical protein
MFFNPVSQWFLPSFEYLEIIVPQYIKAEVLSERVNKVEHRNCVDRVFLPPIAKNILVTSSCPGL